MDERPVHELQSKIPVNILHNCLNNAVSLALIKISYLA